MMRRILIATLLLVPSVAVAQRGGRSQADKRTPLFDKDDGQKGPTLRVRDLEDQSPLHLLIDKRKDLRLTDAQVSQLKDAEGKLKDKNSPLLKAVDSLLHDMRVSSSPSDEERTRIRIVRAGIMDNVKSVNENYDASAKEALALLDADQQSKATEMLDKQREERDKMLRERLGGGGRP